MLTLTSLLFSATMSQSLLECKASLITRPDFKGNSFLWNRVWLLILCTQETEQPIVVLKERICFDHLHIYVITFEFELKSVSHDTDIKSYLFSLSFLPIKQSFRTIIAPETSNIARHDHKLCLLKNNRPDNRCLFKNNTQLSQDTGDTKFPTHPIDSTCTLYTWVKNV